VPGGIFTWTVVHHTTLKEFKALTPYVVALIEVPAAGIRMMGHVQADPAGINFGQPVTWAVDPTGRSVPAVFWIPD
jgi:uncharacterized OB-fold protein